VKLVLEGPDRSAIARELLARLGPRAGGVITVPIRQGDSVVGYRVRTPDGREGTIAHIAGASLYRAGKFKVNVPEIDAVAVPAIREALRSNLVVLIDEVNKMCLFSEKFRQAVLEAMDSDRHVVVTLQDKPHGFVDRLRPRLDAVRSLEAALERLG
jgi:nucleoside-triphosphatase